MTALDRIARQVAVCASLLGVTPIGTSASDCDPDPESSRAHWPGIPPADGRVRWVENGGQWPAAVRFMAQLPGAVARIEGSGWVLDLQDRGGGKRALVRFSFEGASPEASWSGERLLAGRFHYYLGDDPAQWRRNVRSFAQVRCDGLYPGIDLLLRSREGRLKYDLFVAPHADLDLVRLGYEGTGLEDSASGERGQRSSFGDVHHQSGASWQLLPGGERRAVECEWVAVGENDLAVRCPGRDPELPLVIDPDLVWATYLGSSDGGQGDSGQGTAVGTNGDVMAVGRANGTDFPQTPGSVQFPGSYSNNAFVTKLGAANGELIYSSVLGGSGTSRATAVVLDDEGKATVVGWTDADDFPVTPGAFDTESAPITQSTFVTQFSTSGDELVFSTYLDGATSTSKPGGVGLDPEGNVVVGGVAGPDFPTTRGTPGVTYGGDADGFVAELDPTGSTLRWATFLGGSRFDYVVDLAVGSDGTVTAMGYTGSTDFPTTPGAFMTTKPWVSSTFVFVSRLDTDGEELIWSSYLGGNDMGSDDTSTPTTMDVDAFGTVTVGGSTDSTTFPTTPGAYMESAPTDSGGPFVTRFQADGSDLIASTYFRGSIQALSVDRSGIPTVGGSSGTGFPTTPGSYDPTWNGSTDFFVVRLSPALDRIYYASYIGGPDSDDGHGLAQGAGGRVSMTGFVFSPGGFPTTPDSAFPEFQGGGADAVVVTLDLEFEGAREYGSSTPACLGPLRIGVTERPVAGDDDFAFYCSGAPPNAQGWLLVSEAAAELEDADTTRAALWVDRSRMRARLPVASDAFGFTETPFPLRPELAGRTLYFQYLFANPMDCTGEATTSSSRGLAVTAAAN